PTFRDHALGLFAALLELLLERCELGKGRIGIRLFVATAAAVRFGVILIALGFLNAIAAVAAARTTAGWRARFAALIAAFGLLATLAPILAEGAVAPFAVTDAILLRRRGRLFRLGCGNDFRRCGFCGCRS